MVRLKSLKLRHKTCLAVEPIVRPDYNDFKYSISAALSGSLRLRLKGS